MRNKNLFSILKLDTAGNGPYHVQNELPVSRLIQR